MDEQHVFTVSELNRTARELVEGELGGIWLKGEISEVSHAASGHLYFGLKDEAAEISAVRFRSRSPVLSSIEPGMMVLAFGKLTIYEPRGRYQFVATLVQPAGAGLLLAAFERLKEKLHVEGLFDVRYKQPLPGFPRLIGVITSPTGAAFRDIVSVLARRWPVAELLLFASSVQGDAAPDELVAALDRARRYAETARPLDLLVLGRGGGAAEDLAPFNDERVARAVFACPIPIVSAVGHEIDFAITDFVADLRAPTPSAAAELVTPDRGQILDRLRSDHARRMQALTARFDARSRALHTALRRSLFRAPQRGLETVEQRLDIQANALSRFARRVLERPTERLARLEAVLRLADPKRPLDRGFSLTFAAEGGTPLRDASAVHPGSRIVTHLARGRLTSHVEEVSEK